ncbi:MAG: hypothetical protein R6X17_03500 [Candidatus Competibacteraceae bacterium]
MRSSASFSPVTRRDSPAAHGLRAAHRLAHFQASVEKNAAWESC